MMRTLKPWAFVLLLGSTATAMAALLCYFPATGPCNTPGVSVYPCPYESAEYIKILDAEPGVTVNKCVTIAYTTTGNTQCQNDGLQIRCRYWVAVTLCDDSTMDVFADPLYQPKTPGGGQECSL